ncbi:MAG: hypothetical protein ABIR29_02950 [Chthoniobacterales bacterium]
MHLVNFEARPRQIARHPRHLGPIEQHPARTVQHQNRPVHASRRRRVDIRQDFHPAAFEMLLPDGESALLSYPRRGAPTPRQEPECAKYRAQ